MPSFFNVKFSTNPLKRLRLRGRGRDCCLLLLGGFREISCDGQTLFIVSRARDVR